MARALQDLLRESTERAPEAPCLRFSGAEVSYAQLERESNQLARLLIETSVVRGDRVGIYMPKSPRVVASMLGTLKAGAVYVPIDPLAPPARAATIAADAGLSHLVATPERLANWLDERPLPNSLRQVIVTGEATPSLGATLPAACRYDAHREFSGGPICLAERDERELAYILYTSGSTGKPKGVTISHGNALAFVDWACAEFGLSASDRLSNHAPFHFDLTVFDLYAALSAGACCTIIDEVTARSAAQLLALVRDAELSVWYSVPSALRMLLDQSDFESAPPTSLRLVLFAGEEFPLAHLRRVINALPDARHYNLYGPTETNVCTYYQVQGQELGREALPIGRACSGATLVVRDAEGKALAPGPIGELFVRGPTVMCGYWPEARDSNAEYATGDRVSWDEAGELLYHGRKDFMVKVRGHRVEIHDVEFALQAHPAVGDVVVTACEEGEASKVLVAHVVARDASLSVLEIKAHCAKLLPHYMVPHRVQLLEMLPTTSTGKVDRQRLQRDYEGLLAKRRASIGGRHTDAAQRRPS